MAAKAVHASFIRNNEQVQKLSVPALFVSRFFYWGRFVLGIFELFLIAIGLSADAFAVALCKGLNMRRLNLHYAIIIAVFFGGFQAAMPMLGFILGNQFEAYITGFDHWVAFILLAFIGGKMLMEAFRKDDECAATSEVSDLLDMKELVILAIATSIDALAVGITFAFLKISIMPAITFIGITTFILSLIGVALGNRFGIKYKSKAEIAGGFALIFIGIKILLEHINIL